MYNMHALVAPYGLHDGLPTYLHACINLDTCSTGALLELSLQVPCSSFHWLITFVPFSFHSLPVCLHHSFSQVFCSLIPCAPKSISVCISLRQLHAFRACHAVCGAHMGAASRRRIVGHHLFSLQPCVTC